MLHMTRITMGPVCVMIVYRLFKSLFVSPLQRSKTVYICVQLSVACLSSFAFPLFNCSYVHMFAA